MAVGLALLASQVLLGALNVLLEEHAALIVAHLVIATLLWSTVLLIGFTLAFSPAPVGARSAPRAPTSSTAAAEA
jgi:heme A synthase